VAAEHKHGAAMITRAFVLGAGLGMRLRPLTEDLPKPLIPIFQKPLITFVLDHLMAAGVRSFVINTHHRPKVFREFFADGHYRNCPVDLVHEPEILGTGGGIKNVERLFRDGPFIVYSGDILTNIDLARVLEAHSSLGNDVTLAVRETHLGRDIAVEGNRVIDIENRYGHPGRCDFAGISIWTPAIFERIPPGQSVSFIPIVRDWIGEGGKIGGVIANEGKWFNIGDRREYLDVHRTIAKENWRPAYVREAGWPMQIAASSKIDPSARLSGFYSVGADCVIGEGARIEDTILWPSAQIASRSHLRNCIVRSHRKAEGNLSESDI
jgi:mannose-1-phosphate guanylyltransferase